MVCILSTIYDEEAVNRSGSQLNSLSAQLETNPVASSSTSQPRGVVGIRAEKGGRTVVALKQLQAEGVRVVASKAFCGVQQKPYSPGEA